MQYLISRFNKDGINRYKEIGFRLLFYNSYIKQIEKLIESSLQDIEKNELIPSESIAHKYATLQYSHYKDIYYESLIISMYSFCETSLFSLCKVLEKDQKIKVSDFGGKGVFKYKQYLEKIIDLNFSAIATEWELLLQYNKLRNQLVHSSEKRKITKELEESVKKINGVEIIKNEFGTEFFFANIFVLTDLRNIIEKILDHLNFEKSNSKTE